MYRKRSHVWFWAHYLDLTSRFTVWMNQKGSFQPFWLFVCLFIYIPQQRVSVFRKQAQINILYAAHKEINAWVTEWAAEVWNKQTEHDIILLMFVGMRNTLGMALLWLIFLENVDIVMPLKVWYMFGPSRWKKVSEWYQWGCWISRSFIAQTYALKTPPRPSDMSVWEGNWRRLCHY